MSRLTSRSQQLWLSDCLRRADLSSVSQRNRETKEAWRAHEAKREVSGGSRRLWGKSVDKGRQDGRGNRLV